MRKRCNKQDNNANCKVKLWQNTNKLFQGPIQAILMPIHREFIGRQIDITCMAN
jgi:hypothetical protein